MLLVLFHKIRWFLGGKEIGSLLLLLEKERNKNNTTIEVILFLTETLYPTI